MEKLDLTKKYKRYYTAKTQPELIHIEKASYLTISGKGDPSQKDFGERTASLFAIAYKTKFVLKAADQDFIVAKLEAQWWFDAAAYKDIPMAEAPRRIPRKEWEYQLMIRMPEFVTAEIVSRVKEDLSKKKQLKFTRDVNLQEMEEGLCVQMLHVGPFDKEPETLEQIQIFVRNKNLSQNGRHREIYLSDFRKTSPEKLKTILREPVR